MDPVTFPQTIEGERVTLRKHQLDFAQRLFRLVDNNRAQLGQFLSFVDYTKSISDSEDFIRDSMATWERQEEFDYAIFYENTEELIGTISLFKINWKHDCAELGYWMSSSYQGRGLMGEAVRVLQKQAFSLGIHRLEIRTGIDNKKSLAVAKRCGFHQEGILRDVCKLRDEFRNQVVFSRLSTDE